MDDRDWLTLLLDDAPPAELRRQRDRLCTGPGPLPRPDADRQLGEAMQLRTLLAERRQRTAGLTALNDTALALASLHGTEIGSLLELVVARAKQLLGVDLAYLGLVHGDEMSIAAASGAVTRDLVGLTVPTRAGLAGQVTARREPVWTSDYRATSFEHLADVDKVAEAELYRSLLGVPLLSQDELIGLLFACKRYERQFAAEEIATLTTLGAHATAAIVNRRRLAGPPPRSPPSTRRTSGCAHAATCSSRPPARATSWTPWWPGPRGPTRSPKKPASRPAATSAT